MVRNLVISEVRKSKRLQIDKLADNLKNQSYGQNNWWKTLKNFIKPSQNTSIPPLQLNDEVFSDDQDKADILNHFFTAQTVLDDRGATLPTAAARGNFSLDAISLSPLEVESILKSLKLGKASGPDQINNRILKELAHSLSFPLCDLFNYSLSCGKVPELWKQANVTPIFKKGDQSEVSNYRPISLLSTIGKAMEKLVHKYVFNFFLEHHVITTLQSGFTAGDSTVNQLVDIYNTFCRALDEGKEVRAVFFDISKAFDRVWHKGLLYKLHSVGISGNLLDWFADYLSERKQRVVLPGVSSDWSTLEAGVPQGSILGPLLFLVYINDIVEDINATIRLFADDTSLYIIVDSPLDAAITLNNDVSKVYAWAKKWLVNFNPNKSETLLLSRKLNKPYHPPICMNNQPISEVNSHKHLGLILSNDCTWHAHFELMKTKAWLRINVMRKLKFQLDRKSLQIIYFSFIRPLLEYGDVIWNNCAQYEANELEKIQYEAARIVSGATKLVSINALLKETGWEPLSSRRRKHKLVLFYKMVNGLCPDYLHSLVPPTIGNTSRYNLRNINDLQTVHAKTQLYFNSFLPSVIREWNELPQPTRDSTSISSFKYRLDSITRETKPPSYYYEGKRLGQIYHTRLRTGCSSLNQHLFSKNIVDSPLCDCGSIEDTTHYLLNCTRYNNIRHQMFNSVSRFCNPTLHTLLCGNSNLTNDKNKSIMIAVQEFITQSGRFKIQ